MIDRATVNLYGCCKCNYKWISGWDTSSNKERPIPGYCPKCKNVRWNQKYTKEEDSLFDTLLKQHIVSKKSEVDEYSRFVAETTGRQISQIVVYIDYIAHLFLFGIKPFPDMFELKQILEIPKSNIEERHDLMLSISTKTTDTSNKENTTSLSRRKVHAQIYFRRRIRRSTMP